MSEVVTVRVTKSLKQKTQKYKINISETVREALEEEVKKHEDEEFAQAFATMKAILQKIPDEEIIKAVRESRDQR